MASPNIHIVSKSKCPSRDSSRTKRRGSDSRSRSRGRSVSSSQADGRRTRSLSTSSQRNDRLVIVGVGGEIWSKTDSFRGNVQSTASAQRMPSRSRSQAPQQTSTKSNSFHGSVQSTASAQGRSSRSRSQTPRKNGSGGIKGGSSNGTVQECKHRDECRKGARQPRSSSRQRPKQQDDWLSEVMDNLAETRNNLKARRACLEAARNPTESKSSCRDRKTLGVVGNSTYRCQDFNASEPNVSSNRQSDSSQVSRSRRVSKDRQHSSRSRASVHLGTSTSRREDFNASEPNVSSNRKSDSSQVSRCRSVSKDRQHSSRSRASVHLGTLTSRREDFNASEPNVSSNRKSDFSQVSRCRSISKDRQQSSRPTENFLSRNSSSDNSFKSSRRVHVDEMNRVKKPSSTSRVLDVTSEHSSAETSNKSAVTWLELHGKIVSRQKSSRASGGASVVSSVMSNKSSVSRVDNFLNERNGSLQKTATRSNTTDIAHTKAKSQDPTDVAASNRSKKNSSSVLANDDVDFYSSEPNLYKSGLVAAALVNYQNQVNSAVDVTQPHPFKTTRSPRQDSSRALTYASPSSSPRPRGTTNQDASNDSEPNLSSTSSFTTSDSRAMTLLHEKQQILPNSKQVGWERSEEMLPRLGSSKLNSPEHYEQSLTTLNLRCNDRNQQSKVGLRVSFKDTPDLKDAPANLSPEEEQSIATQSLLSKWAQRLQESDRKLSGVSLAEEEKKHDEDLDRSVSKRNAEVLLFPPPRPRKEQQKFVKIHPPLSDTEGTLSTASSTQESDDSSICREMECVRGPALPEKNEQSRHRPSFSSRSLSVDMNIGSAKSCNVGHCKSGAHFARRNTTGKSYQPDEFVPISIGAVQGSNKSKVNPSSSQVDNGKATRGTDENVLELLQPPPPPPPPRRNPMPLQRIKMQSAPRSKEEVMKSVSMVAARKTPLPPPPPRC